MERKRNPGQAVPLAMSFPHYAEFIIGAAKGRTRWLHAAYYEAGPSA